MKLVKQIVQRDVGPIILCYIAILTGATAYWSETWWYTALMAVITYAAYGLAKKLDAKA